MQDFIKLKQQLEILWQEVERLERETPEPGPGGTSDYTELSNKPSINGVELNGNKTLTQLGIAPAATICMIMTATPFAIAVKKLELQYTHIVITVIQVVIYAVLSELFLIIFILIHAIQLATSVVQLEQQLTHMIMLVMRFVMFVQKQEL